MTIRRRVAALAIVLASLLVCAGSFEPRFVEAQARCSFKLGFKALHDLIPDIVGDCVGDESWNANGDATQRTRNGLLAWRRANNWTTFTDGSTTWINGPVGLVSRPNAGPLFDWESRAPGAVGAPLTGSGAQAYLAYMSPRLQKVRNTLEGIHEHFSPASANIAILSDADWRAKTDSLMAQLRSAGVELQTYAPVPPEVEALDVMLKSAGEDLVYVADQMIAGLDRGDVVQLNNATNRLNVVTAKMATASAQVQALDQPSAPVASAPSPATPPARPAPAQLPPPPTSTPTPKDLQRVPR